MGEGIAGAVQDFRRKASIVAQSEPLVFRARPGIERDQVDLGRATPLSKRTRSFASASVSLIPFSITYSKVTRFELGEVPDIAGWTRNSSFQNCTFLIEAARAGCARSSLGSRARLIAQHGGRWRLPQLRNFWGRDGRRWTR